METWQQPTSYTLLKIEVNDFALFVYAAVFELLIRISLINDDVCKADVISVRIIKVM